MVFLFKYFSLTMQLTWFFEIDFPEYDTFYPWLFYNLGLLLVLLWLHITTALPPGGGVDMCKVTGVEYEGSV